MQSAIINVMSAAAIKAGKSLLRDFSEVDKLQVSRKGTADFVTTADTRTEKLLQRELSKARPEFSFLLEESGEIIGKDPSHRWIVDPIDGTFNFVHAIPYFCISIGLEHINSRGKSEILAGVIYDPIHNELFFAEKGKGAFLNDRRISVSQRTAMEDSLLVTAKPMSNGKPQPRYVDTVLKLASSGGTIRYFGATALDLAYLAAGRIDACWYYTIRPWDIAAGILLVEEAGGSVTDLNGQHCGAFTENLLCSNPKLHTPLQKVIAQAA